MRKVDGVTFRSIRCKKTNVNAYHHDLSIAAKDVLRNPFNIQPVKVQGDWMKIARGAKLPARISFSIVSGIVTAASGRNQSEHVLKIPELPDIETNLGWWLSWFEVWETIPDSPQEVTLHSSSLGFYSGNRHAGEPEQLVFRAEWGPLESGLVQSGKAAQPHWHAHMDVVCQSVQDSTSLVELHGIHLPMGGWTHSDKSESAICWQFVPATDGPAILRDWAIRTIKYFQSQLGEEKIIRA